jgi:hypothetical protein
MPIIKTRGELGLDRPQPTNTKASKQHENDDARRM